MFMYVLFIVLVLRHVFSVICAIIISINIRLINQIFHYSKSNTNMGIELGGGIGISDMVFFVDWGQCISVVDHKISII